MRPVVGCHYDGSGDLRIRVVMCGSEDGITLKLKRSAGILLPG